MSTNVSILARPFERALPPRAQRVPGLVWFQSSPALSSGRYITTEYHAVAYASFNPRPPFRAGATLSDALTMLALASFNPRPPFRAGATRDAGAYCGVSKWFQSSPALSSGRYPFTRSEKVSL